LFLKRKKKSLQTPLQSSTPKFIDPKKGSQHYLRRYYNEPAYKLWFDKNYPDYTIEEAIELAIPGSISKLKEIKSLFHKKSKIKNFIIFVSVFSLSLQALLFIHLYGVNVPYGDAWEAVTFFELFFNDDSLWLYQIHLQHNEHRMFFPNLIFLVNAILTSWNVVTQMYLSWALVGISLVPIYLFLKKTKSNLVWLIIPISFLMYSPYQTENFLWGHQIQWFLALASFLWSIYFLSIPKKVFFISAIGLAFVSSYSLMLGLLVWPLGFLNLLYLKNHKKKYLLTWLGCTAVAFSIYFYEFTFPPGHPIILSSSNIDGYLAYVFAYLGSSFSSAWTGNGIIINIIYGIVFLSIILSGIFIHFINKKKTRYNLVPWIQMGLFGFLSALITGIGRQSFGTEQALNSRYVTIDNIFLISALFFWFIIILIYKDELKTFKKRIFVFSMISIFIIFGTVMLSTSYYEGWKSGENTFKNRTESLSCFSLPFEYDYRCKYLYPPSKQHFLKQANTLLSLKLGPFSDSKNNFSYDHDPFFNIEKWDELKESAGFGSIESVNGESIGDKKMVYLDGPTITMSGWILDKNKNKVDNVYLFIDDEPFLRIENFKPRNDIVNKLGSDADSRSGWEFTLFSAYFSENCHNVSIGSVVDEKKILIKTNAQICNKI